MCAMMPMLRVRLSGVCLGIANPSSRLPDCFAAPRGLKPALYDCSNQLPPIVGERLVRLRHTMRVFTLLDGTTAKVRCVQQLVRELLLHRLAVAAIAGV